MSEIVDCIAWIVEKTCWSFYVFCKFICLRILDILGLIFNVLACLTIIRLPCMIRQFLVMTDLNEWRSVGFIHLLIFFMDIPFILMAFTVILFTLGLSMIPMAKEIREKSIKCDYSHRDQGSDIYFGGFELRRLVARYFFQHLTGLLCIPLLVITSMSWRCAIVIRKIRPHRYFSWEWRLEIIIQFWQLFVDLPCVFVGILTLVSWRMPFYVKEVKAMRKDHSWTKWRFLAFKHFALLFVDFFCFLLFALTFITWRCPFMIKELRQNCTSQWEARTIVLQQFALIFVDIPCILCFFVVLITLWRLPRFIENYEDDQWEIRSNCLIQFAMLFVDFCCFLLFLIIMLTLWRLYPVIRDIRKYRRRQQLESTDTSWKIRLIICKHVAFLLVDIPAIIMALLHLITLFRVQSLLSKLLQSGDFYTEFAMIVLTETWKLLIDIFFLIFFIILMILRPVAAWVKLLEDEEHLQYRNVCFYTKWVPDIIKDTKKQTSNTLEEVFSSCLKQKESCEETRVRLSQVCTECLQQWQWLRSKVSVYDMYPELPHLIDMVIWYEKQRPYHLIRLYSCEIYYLARPVSLIHDQTLSTYQSEMAEFEEKLSSAYKKIQDYTPAKVPLWSNKSGLMTRSRRETQHVLLKLPGGNFFLFIVFILNVLPLYRAPGLIVSLYRRWYDRRAILLSSCREYLLDILTFLRILVVLLSLYRAPALLLDLTIDIFQKRSWKAARATAKRYPPEIVEDLLLLVTHVLHWRTIRFIFTLVLFGIFVPADLILTVLKLEIKKCRSYIITAFVFITLLFFPFAFAFHFGEVLVSKGYGDVISYIISGYGLYIVAVLMFLIRIFLKRRGTTFSVAPKPYDYIRLNSSNTHVIVFEVVELLQLVAIVFSLENIPIKGGDMLHRYANYLLFNFASFEVKLSLTVIGFFIWFITCGAPIIFEHILEDLEKGTCAANGGWRLLMVLFYNTLFVSIIEGLCGLLSCEYDDMCSDNQPNVKNSTCYVSTLVDEQTIHCWVGDHRIYALFGLWGLLWYTTTAILYGTQYGEVDSPDVDIEFSPVYNTVVNILKALMIGAVVLISQEFFVVMVILLILCLIAIFITIFFKRFVGYKSCNSTVVGIFRVASFFIFAVTIVTAVVAKLINNENSNVPLILLLAGIGCTLFVSVVAAIKHRRQTETEKERQLFRETLLRFEEQLNQNGSFVTSWGKQRKTWRRLVRHVYEAQSGDRNMSSELWQRFALPHDEYSPPPVSQLADDNHRGSAFIQPPPPLPKSTQPEPDARTPESNLFNTSNDEGECGVSEDTNERPLEAFHPSYYSDAQRLSENNPALDIYEFDEFMSKRQVYYKTGRNETLEKFKMAKLQCNGKNLLLHFERFIHYRSFSFAFVSQIPVWRQAVNGSNWIGLYHCLQVLQGSLTKTYDKPSELDVSLGITSVPLCALPPNLDRRVPPVFTPEPRDPEIIRQQSESAREQALGDIERVSADEPIWLPLFLKLLPTLPVIRKWSFDEESRVFELLLRRSCQATITDVGPQGVKLAKGAVISLPKCLRGTLTDDELVFEKNFQPIGKKGPVALALYDIRLVKSQEKVYFTSNGKKINVVKAMDSLGALKWS